MSETASVAWLERMIDKYGLKRPPEGKRIMPVRTIEKPKRNQTAVSCWDSCKDRLCEIISCVIVTPLPFR